MHLIHYRRCCIRHTPRSYCKSIQSFGVSRTVLRSSDHTRHALRRSFVRSDGCMPGKLVLYCMSRILRSLDAWIIQPLALLHADYLEVTLHSSIYVNLCMWLQYIKQLNTYLLHLLLLQHMIDLNRANTLVHLIIFCSFLLRNMKHPVFSV